MNRITTYILLVLLPLFVSAQETAYLNQIAVGNYTLQKPQGSNNAHLLIELDFDSLHIDSQDALRIVPVLYSADGTHQLHLTALQLYGTQRYKVVERANTLNSEPITNNGDRLHRYLPGNTAPLTYRVTVPYALWMADSHLRSGMCRL